jgi:hypothetical protein
VFYHYVISARNNLFEGIQSDPILIIAADLPIQPPNPPTILSFSSTTVTLSVDALTGSQTGGSPITGYIIAVDNMDQSDLGKFVVVSNNLQTTITLNNLNPSGTNQYRVKYAARNLVYD